jgi:tRNA pseudouridine38/39 synthase
VVLRVRSNKALPKAASENGDQATLEGSAVDSRDGDPVAAQAEQPFDDLKDEINYPAILNRVLPPSIRILAWSPAPSPSFNARFSCRERRYRYFFTQPAYLPTPDPRTSSANLDLDAMKEAASYLVGSHDFRNFCKIDPSKQLTTFVRRITYASIEEVSVADLPHLGDILATSPQDTGIKVYTFNIHGSAFLWHQVRCIVAVLFLVGQKLEQPGVIRDMLDMSLNGPDSGGRPRYEMADDKPLVLWDCIYPIDRATGEVPPVGWEPTNENGEIVAMEDLINWIHPTVQDGGEATWGPTGILSSLWKQWRAAKMDELLAASLLDRARSFGGATTSTTINLASRSTRVFGGADESRPVGRYVPLLQRGRLESPEVLNARYAAKMGWPGVRGKEQSGGVDDLGRDND